jgi:hypothetical protein
MIKKFYTISFLFLVLMTLNFRLFASKGFVFENLKIEVDKPKDPPNERIFQLEKGKEGREVFLPELSLIKSNFIFFDPLIFSITCNKDSVEIGEQFELNINVELNSFSSASIFQVPGLNEYTLKLLFPSNFVRTGGDFVELLPDKLDKLNNKRKFTVKGYFESGGTEQPFRLLRGHPNNQDGYFIVKKEFVLPTKSKFLNNIIEKEIGKPKFEKLDLKDYEARSVTNCGNSPPAPTITLGQSYCNSFSITANCPSNTTPQWDDLINGSSRIITESMVLKARCVPDIECPGPWSGSQSYSKVAKPRAPRMWYNPSICNNTLTGIESEFCINKTVWWNGIETSPNSEGRSLYPNLVPAGEYKVQCKDFYCSLLSDEVIVKITYKSSPPQPIVELVNSENNLVCNTSETKNIKATNCNGSIKWQKLGDSGYLTQTSNQISVSEGYYRAVCYYNDCPNVINESPYFQIRLQSTNAISVINKTICAGTTTQMEYTGCSNGTVKWMNLSNQEIQNNFEPGTYQVECKNACNSVINTVQFTISTLNKPADVYLSGNLSICGVNTTTLNYSGGAGGTITFWNGVTPIANLANISSQSFLESVLKINVDTLMTLRRWYIHHNVLISNLHLQEIHVLTLSA